MERSVFRRWFEAQIQERRWGVAEAARHIGISHAQVSRYLNGLAKPERRALRAISETFGVPRDELEAMVDAGRRPGLGKRTTDGVIMAAPEEVFSRLSSDFYKLLMAWSDLTTEEQEDVLATHAHAVGAAERRRGEGEGSGADGDQPGAAGPS